jgi:D-alanyl-D-alanine carboxypeptidase
LFRGLLLTGEKAASRLGLASEPFSKVLWVKTGFLEGVVTAAGFLQLESGEFACFCFMVNNSSDSASAIRQSFGTILRAIYKTQG